MVRKSDQDSSWTSLWGGFFSGRRPQGRPRSLGTEELLQVAGERNIWTFMLRLLPRDLDPDKRKKTKRNETFGVEKPQSQSSRYLIEFSILLVLELLEYPKCLWH